MLNPKNPDYTNTPVSPQRPGFLYQPERTDLPPAVSIITPFFNTGAIFDETARSVMQQSLQQWEWIIVNDGSSDPESLQILEKYRHCDARVRVIDHPANRGLPAARNTGAAAARSDFLLYLDSDDLLEPTTAEKWLWFLVGHPNYSFAGGYSVSFGARQFLWHGGFQDNEKNVLENRINHVVMVRKEVHQAVGGYDESMVGGLEDWDFWVRCADKGYWGDSIPEYLHWYRTRPSHTDRWEGLQPERLRRKRDEYRRRYPGLLKGAFPNVHPYVDLNLIDMQETFACENRLKKTKPRLLLIAPWMVTGGAEKFNLDLIGQLNLLGWETSLVTTLPSENPWQHEFERLTPDVFALANFLEWADYPRFISYLIRSRQVDAVLLSASQETYRLLPYLRLRFPELPILDYLHFVTPDWMDGGFPRLSLLFQSCLDLSAVTSRQVKDWLVAEGAPEDRVHICTANVDTDFWKPDPEKRREMRAQLGIADNHPLLLYIGRLEQQKQPRVFAKTMHRLSRENVPFTCLVIGDGSFRDWLEKFIWQHKLGERVRLMGRLPLNQVHELVVAGDIVFLPSENEGISLTFFEGMACGLVPVGADVGGQSQLVTPECGILLKRSTEDDEAERYAAALAGLLRDPQRIQRMGQASFERVTQHFRLDQMAKRMVELIHEAGRLRKEQPRCPDQDELAGLLARQAAEYMRAVLEVRRLGQMSEENYRMPPAPARTYLYFAIRQALYPLLKPFIGRPWLNKWKSRVKSVLVRV